MNMLKKWRLEQINLKQPKNLPIPNGNIAEYSVIDMAGLYERLDNTLTNIIIQLLAVCRNILTTMGTCRYWCKYILVEFTSGPLQHNGCIFYVSFFLYIFNTLGQAHVGYLTLCLSW